MQQKNKSLNAHLKVVAKRSRKAQSWQQGSFTYSHTFYSSLSLSLSISPSQPLAYSFTYPKRAPWHAIGLLHTCIHTLSLAHTHRQIDTVCWAFLHANFCCSPLCPRRHFYLSSTFVFAAASITNVPRRARVFVAIVACFPPKRYKIAASCIIYCNCGGKTHVFLTLSLPALKKIFAPLKFCAPFF